MHELSIVVGLFDLLQKEMAKINGKQVTRVTLRIGSLSGVIPVYIEEMFHEYAKDTFASGAELVINSVEPLAECSDCRKSFTAENFFLNCPFCGSRNCRIIKGMELYLESAEIVTD
jgi:hydrogenase nickel incorporation protein HypA/HybF